MVWRSFTLHDATLEEKEPLNIGDGIHLFRKSLEGHLTLTMYGHMSL